jgi:hypothetical protein
VILDVMAANILVGERPNVPNAQRRTACPL